jgi:hypothetical protein
MKRHKDTLSVSAAERSGLVVNADKTRSIFITCQQNAGQNNSTKIVNKSFEKVPTSKQVGTVLYITVKLPAQRN